MTDPTIAAIDTVPEADLAEQSVPAYLDEDEVEPEFPTTAADREAAEADVIEQAIPVPFEDDYDENSDIEY